MIRRITMTTILLFAVVGFATAAVAGQTATATEAVNETTATETVNETSTAEPAGPDENASDSAVGPGERLSGVIGVQEAELEGEVAERTFGIQVAQAASEDAKAKVVGEQLNEIEERIDSLEAERDRLADARENGSISEGEYRAHVSKLAAEQRTIERLANASNETASELPRETLEANGVNVDAIQTLKNRASELTGPEVAGIARSIAGPPEGVPGSGPPERAGPPDNRNESDQPDEDRHGGEENESDRPGSADSGNETADDAGSEQRRDGDGTATEDDSETTDADSDASTEQSQEEGY